MGKYFRIGYGSDPEYTMKGLARVGEALMGLHRTCTQVRFLGSYPRADGALVSVPSGTTDAAFEQAGAWLSALRRGEA